MPHLTHGCLRAVCGWQFLQLSLVLGQLDPSTRDLKQIPPVLLVDMLRHVETPRRAIKAESTFRLHVPPFWYLWPNPENWIHWIRFLNAGLPQFKGSKSNGRAGVGARPSVSTNWLTFPLNTKLSAELRKEHAKRAPQLAYSRGIGACTAIRVEGPSRHFGRGSLRPRVLALRHRKAL